MHFYLLQWSYKDPEIRAMVTKPQDREEIVRLVTEAFGGRLHSFFLCFGEFDGVAIVEFPDNQTALASMMAIVAKGGLVTIKTTPLLTSQESKEAMLLAHHTVAPYQPPSGSS
jgi:uncharacterized protein with GYD domain